MNYRTQYKHYPDNIQQNKRKSLTIQGQVIPMRQIVERYASGQLFGISSIPLEYDGEIDENNHVMYEVDPCDPLFIERTAMLNKEINVKITKHVEEYKKQKSSKVEDPT